MQSRLELMAMAKQRVHVSRSYIVERLEGRVLLSGNPTITSVSDNPLNFDSLSGHIPWDINGSNFAIPTPPTSGDVVLTAPNDQAVDLIPYVSNASSSQIALSTSGEDLNLADMPPGTWTLQVTNPDSTASNVYPFELTTPAAPTITGVTATGSAGSSVSVTISGTNFQVNSGAFDQDGMGEADVTLISPGNTTINELTDDNVDLSSSTDTAIDITASNLTEAGQWHAVVTNINGTVSPAYAFTISSATAAGPTITTEPVSASVASGGSATFSVAASGATPLSYQWLFNGSTLAGDTLSTLTLTPATSAQAGAYTVVVSDSAGSITSNAAQLSVQPLAYVLAGPVDAKAGKTAKSTLTVRNSSGQSVKQVLSIRLLVSTNDTLSGQVASVFEGTKTVNLKTDRSKRFTLSFKFPAVGAGSYKLLAQVDGQSPIVAESATLVQAARGRKVVPSLLSDFNDAEW